MTEMAFREVLVTQVKEVLRASLAGLGKCPAVARAGVSVKTGGPVYPGYSGGRACP
jgi:hypothetical protein